MASPPYVPIMILTYVPLCVKAGPFQPLISFAGVRCERPEHPLQPPGPLLEDAGALPRPGVECLFKSMTPAAGCGMASAYAACRNASATSWISGAVPGDPPGDSNRFFAALAVVVDIPA